MTDRRGTFRRRPLLSSSSCGFFDCLPREILFEILDLLPLADVGNLALTSEGFRLWVAGWVPTRRCLSRASIPLDREFPDPSKNVIASGAYQRSAGTALQTLRGPPTLNPFAVLCKRMTCLLNTRERIRYAFRLFDRSLRECCTTTATPLVSEDHRSLSRHEQICKDWLATEKIIQFIIMLHTFIRGWDESEFPLLLQETDRKFKLLDKVKRFFSSYRRNDACLHTEIDIRLFTRCLSWDFAGSDYSLRASWLLAIMKYFVGSNEEDSARRQATLFLLIFGPSCHDGRSLNHIDQPFRLNHSQRLILNELNNHTDWESFVESVPDSFHEGKDMFYTLAQAICSCFSASQTWKRRLARPLLDEMFLTPRKWRRENIAGFLLFCSEGLILHYLQAIIDTGDVEGIRRVASLLMDMIMVSHKFDNHLTEEIGIGKVFDAMVCYPTGDTRRRLHLEVWRWLASEVEHETLEMEEDEIYEVFRGFCQHIMRKAYITSPARALRIKKIQEADTDVETVDEESSDKEMDGSQEREE